MGDLTCEVFLSLDQIGQIVTYNSRIFLPTVHYLRVIYEN